MIRERLRQRWEKWLAVRIRPVNAVTLEQNRIFIFLSRTGLGFLLLLTVLLAMAINYQNNLIFGLTFWLFSLLLVVIFHTYANFAGLEMQSGGASTVFAGGVAEFTLHLRSHKRERVAIQIGWPELGMQTVWLAAGEEKQLVLRHGAERRGLYRPPRLRLESHFPLALLRTWSWVQLDWQALVYPAPFWPGDIPQREGDQEGAAVTAEAWGDDFAGFHQYQPGESLRRAYWRAYAKGLPLLIMDHAQSIESEIWLDWNALPALPVEQRLSGLCAWVLHCEQENVLYGMRLPGAEFAPHKGDRHRDACLKALALYGGAGGKTPAQGAS